MNYNERKTNAVAVVAIGKSKVWNISKRSIKKYCEKYNLPLEIITTKKYNFGDKDHYANFNMFEKNQVYNLFNKYDRILRLDWDVIITPYCPNLFEIVPKDKIGVVFEDVGPYKQHRRGLIKKIQDSLGDLGWRSGYFNAGVMVVSKQHKKIFHVSKKEQLEFINNLKIVNKEQTYINFIIRKLGYEICELNYKFNHTAIFSQNWNENKINES
ncbi:MAG: glycosyltransferase [Promethearchaeota archaeon]